MKDTENLPPAVLAQEIAEQLKAALEEFRSMEEVLAGNGDRELKYMRNIFNQYFRPENRLMLGRISG